MLKLILVRACETDYDRQGRIHGTIDMPLSTEGVQQAQRVAAELAAVFAEDPPTALYTGPATAAVETARRLADALELKLKSVSKLQNLDHGLWEGLLVSDVKAKQPKVYRQWQEQPETVCPPQGESVMAAKKRVAEALRKLIKRHRADGAIVVVAPEPLASLIGHVLRRDEVVELWKTAEEIVRWEAIEIDPAETGDA